VGYFNNESNHLVIGTRISSTKLYECGAGTIDKIQFGTVFKSGEAITTGITESAAESMGFKPGTKAVAISLIDAYAAASGSLGCENSNQI
jgi:ribulose kinase